MPTNLPAKYQVNIGAASANAAGTSGATGSPWFVGDFARLTVSIQTSTTSASRFTIYGSNADGFTEALNTASASGVSGHWSHITVITGGQGIYTIDPGFRWVNSCRPDFTTSVGSGATVVFTGSY